MRNKVGNATSSKLNPPDLAQLVLGLLSGDAVDGEAALGVVDETEVLASLLDTDDVHEAGGVGSVGPDLAVDLDEALHHDGLGLATMQRTQCQFTPPVLRFSFPERVDNLPVKSIL